MNGLGAGVTPFAALTVPSAEVATGSVVGIGSATTGAVVGVLFEPIEKKGLLLLQPLVAIAITIAEYAIRLQRMNLTLNKPGLD